MGGSTPKLYGYWRSSASWRVRWAFELKKIPYEYVPVNFLNGERESPAHLARNPLGALPVLEVSPGQFVSESLAIIEWIEETFPKQGPSLLPGTAIDRACIRQLAEIINSETAPLQTPRAQRKHTDNADERAAWAKHWIVEGLRAFDVLSTPHRKDFCFGNQVTLADLCLIPQIYNALRYSIDVKAQFPALWEIYNRSLATEACAKASPERQSDAV